MSTALAEQLQRLAVPQTTVLKRDKERASLLFDPKEAAGLKRETVYQIGLEGLEELVSKNAVFDQFKNSLFHITSKDFERSVQTTKANEQLDKNIRNFLLHLSPYFPLNSAHKALEWLINRYEVNEYNREDLLMLILPYHESNIFVRVIQILQFKDTNDSFYFLKSLQKPGVHLTKKSLLNHAASDTSFLEFVTKYIMLLIKYHQKPNLLTTAFNYFCSVFVGAIEYSANITEEQLSQMLPPLLKGLNSSIPDFCAASYIITARLVAKTNLSDKLLDKFVEKLSEVRVPGLKMEATLVLIVLYQSQKQYSNIPLTAISNLSEKDWLPKVLQNLNNSGSYIFPFLEKLVKRCIEEGINSDLKVAREFIKNSLEEIKLEDSFVDIFLQTILDSTRSKMDYSEDIKDWSRETLETLEKQYPRIFDKEVYRILSAVEDKKLLKRKKRLSKILKNTMVYKGKFEVFEKLYHPNPQLRSEAIKYLLENFSSLKETEKEGIKISLVDRLNDENVKVVKETLLAVHQMSLLQEEQDLKQVLIRLLNKCLKDKKKWAKVYTSVIKMLCSNSDPKDWNLFFAVFPILLPESPEELMLSKEILKTPFISHHALLKAYTEKLQDIEDVQEFVKLVFESLESSSTWDTINELLEILKTVPIEKQDSHYKYVISLILSNTLPKESSIDGSTLVLEILMNCYTSCKEKSRNKGVAGDTADKNRKEISTQMYLSYLENIINKTKIPEVNLSLADFSINSSERKYFTLLANILIRNNNLYKKTLELYLNRVFPNLQAQVDFLLNLCISENGNLESDFKMRCLIYLLEFLTNKGNEVKQFVLIDYPTSAFLLILLSDCDENVRKLTFEIINFVINISIRKSNSYFFVLEGLKKHQEEIVIDHEQMPLIMFNILDPSNTERGKHTSDLNSIRSHLFKLAYNEESSIYLKAGILKLLSYINTFDVLEEATKLALHVFQKNPDVVERFQAIVIGKVISRIDAKVMSKVDFGSNTFKLIEHALKNDKTVIVNDEVGKISPAILILNQLETEVFAVLQKEVVVKLLDLIMEIATVAKNPEVLPAASRIFKHIDLDLKLIQNELIEMRDVQSPKQDLTKKKRRISIVPTADILDTLEWRKGVTTLEFLQDKKKIRNAGSLLPILFEILKRCLDFDEQAPVEYPKQLLLSLILHCCLKMDNKVLPENIFNMELVVQCIRASQNPQTHHHALLLLAHTASLIPTQVLHNMMAIFTFMGSSVLRHDDAYSFQIITKIVDTIIPILVKDNHISNIAKVLRVFVDALLDVPEHRRIPLYKQLLTNLDVKENLCLFLLIVFESQVLHSNQEKQRKEIASKRLEIAANLCCEFSPEIVIYSCIKLIKYLNNLPDEQLETMKADANADHFNISAHTPKDFRHYKYLLLKFTGNLLASQKFVNQVAALNDEQELLLENLFKEVIINILQYIQRTSKVAENAANTPQAQYWKVILHHSYDILDGINALITPQMFLLVTKGLMVHNLSTIRRRILELLNSKLQYNSQFFSQCEEKEIYALVPPIISIVGSINNQIEQDQETIIQIALLSLKLLVKSLAPKDPEKFVQILEFITQLIKSGKAQNNVLASVLLCLAELCVNLKAYAISGLPDYMPAVIKVLKRQKYDEIPSVLLRSTVTTIEKILDSMPLFLSPYLEKLLMELSKLMSRWGYTTDDQKLQPFVHKLACIKQKIGSVIPSRVLIQAVEQCYNSLIDKKCFAAVSALMDILAENLSNLQGLDINSNLPELTNFFLNALKFRAEANSSLKEATITERHIVDALTVLILKLSESTFRPLYYKLFDWAVRSDVKNERVITFYSLSSGIAESLKGLFVLFAGHFLNNSAQLLDSCNKTKNEEMYFIEEDKNIMLLEYILKTLNAVFMYDNQKFINKDRFDVLMQPLVDQLENTAGGVDDLVRRNKELLTPCLVNFALATADDALWKQMNYQILLKLRHNSPQNRLVALHCLTEIVKKLGEDFLPLLPETIPFLAELLEDEEESVEKACQKAVQEMEKVLGEPLQKYF